jgi:hypothetical protein
MTEQSRDPRPDLVGTWEKADTPPCAQRYPDSLTFAPGTYRGVRGPTQGFVSWDAGTYRVEDPSRLVLTTASDELVPYEIRVDGDVLTVVDPDGCRFSYRRARPPG